jgi:Zn-dependent protease with chaperone function/Tfp pilus assembly protein PilE
MRAPEVRTASERRLYVASLTISIIIWIILLVTIVGLLYSLFIGFFIFAAHALTIAYIKGNAVKLSETQIPNIYRKVVDAAQRLGMPIVPEAYILQSGGVLNAFATKFFSRNFIIINSDLLEACDDNGKEIDMIIGHEIGHLSLGHLRNRWLILPAFLIPWLGPAYSRAREYSCDLCGYEVVGDLEPAVKGITILAAGGKYGRQVDTDTYVKQAQDTCGFWTSVYELNASHPYLPKRVAALINYKNPGAVSDVRRNIFAYPLAPVFAFSSSSGVGLLIVVAIIGVLAAIAIPQFTAYKSSGYCAIAKADLKNAYTASQAFLSEHPNEIISKTTVLSDYGFTKSKDSLIHVNNFSTNNGYIATTHPECNTVYIVDPRGNITEETKNTK